MRLYSFLKHPLSGVPAIPTEGRSSAHVHLPQEAAQLNGGSLRNSNELAGLNGVLDYKPDGAGTELRPCHGMSGSGQKSPTHGAKTGIERNVLDKASDDRYERCCACDVGSTWRNAFEDSPSGEKGRCRVGKARALAAGGGAMMDASREKVQMQCWRHAPHKGTLKLRSRARKKELNSWQARTVSNNAATGSRGHQQRLQAPNHLFSGGPAATQGGHGEVSALVWEGAWPPAAAAAATTVVQVPSLKRHRHVRCPGEIISSPPPPHAHLERRS